MHPEPVIRAATVADAECIAALAIQVWLHTYATEGIRPAIARYVLAEFTAPGFASIMVDSSARLLVAEVDQHLVGYALLKLGTKPPADAQPQGALDVELATLYVQEHFARSGIGSVLLAHSQSLALDLTGSARLWLTVNARNAQAMAFYRTHRFFQTGTAQFEFGEEKHLNLVLLSPELSPHA